MASRDDSRLRIQRIAAFVIGIAVVLLTVLAFATANPVDLAVALLVVLAEVLAVAVLSGPILAVVVALISVGLVNWYLVPPYGTFVVASTENVVTLIVFTFVAAVAAALVELGARARARADVSSRQAGLLGDIVVINQGDDAATALERIRQELLLDRVELRQARGGTVNVVGSAGAGPAAPPAVLDVALADGYSLVGFGRTLFAPDPDFLTSLGSAASLAYERERLEQESRRAEELSAIDRARTTLLASVGHDLRTPLAALRLSVDTLGAGDASLTDADRAELLATISISAERLDELITNLLDMSRLQAGAVIAHATATDVAEVVSRVLLSLPPDRIQVVLPAAIRPASADPALLERMVGNLVSNALRYSPDDTFVSIVINDDGDRVLIEVSDDGPGIPIDQRAEVFRPFHRVGAQADGGSGLGLAIVRGFGDAMGIDVELTTAPSGGLTARLALRPWAT